MKFKRTYFIALRFLLLMFLLVPANAQMQTLMKFEDVKIPFDMQYEDTDIKSGKYDLEFLKHGPNQVYYLKIIKKNKTVCLVSGGKKVDYKGQGSVSLLMKDPDIPEDAKLSVKRNPVLKIAYVILETGKHAKPYPFLKIRFKIKSE